MLDEPIVVGGVDVTQEFVAACDNARRAEIAEAKRSQLEAAKEMAALGIGDRRVAGHAVAHIDPTLYHYWADREPGIWSDPKEVERFKRDNPEIRPTGKRAPVVAGWRPPGAGSREQGAGKKRIGVWKL